MRRWGGLAAVAAGAASCRPGAWVHNLRSALPLLASASLALACKAALERLSEAQVSHFGSLSCALTQPDGAGRCMSSLLASRPFRARARCQQPARPLPGQRLPAVRAPDMAVHPVVGACAAGRWQRCIAVPTRGAVHPARTTPTLTSRRVPSQARRWLPSSWSGQLRPRWQDSAPLPSCVPRSRHPPPGSMHAEAGGASSVQIYFGDDVTCCTKKQKLTG